METRFYRNNRYPGTCTACRAPVAESAGIAYQRPQRRWETLHRSPDCLGAVLTPAELAALQGDHTAATAAAERRELTVEGAVYHPYPDPERYPGAKALLAAFPPSSDRSKPTWDRERKCRWVSLDLGDRPRVLELADKLGLSVPDEIRHYEQQIPPHIKAALDRAEAAGAYPYQLDGIRALALNERWLLGDDMGVGKTMQALLAIPEGMGALVVAPKSLKRNWAAECHKWRPDLSPVVCTATKGRDFRWPEPGEVMITHYESLPAALTAKETPEGFFAGADNTIAIVDEAHRAKNPKAQRSKKIQALAQHCARIWLLTGTPLLNKPFDLLGVLRAGGMDRKALGGFRGFMKLFDGYKNRWGGYEFGDVDPSVPERLRRVMLRRTKPEVLADLPPKVRQVLLVNDTDSKVKKMLDAEWRKFLATKLEKRPEDITDYELEHGVDGEESLPPFSQFSEIRKLLAMSRIDAMDEFVSDAEEQDTPLLVFSAHRGPIDHLAGREGWGVITGDTPDDERQAVVDAFQRGDLKGVGLTIAAGGVGLTLTRASMVLFVDLAWNPKDNVQAEDRAHRIGQKASSLHIVTMVTDHVLDRHVHRLIEAKIALVDAAIERLIDYTAPEAEQDDSIDWDLARKAAEQADREDRLKAVRDRAIKLDLAEAAEGGAYHPGMVVGTNGSGHQASWRSIELTEQQVSDVRAAWSWMLGRCDGARELDGEGFNKPDAVLAHLIMPVLDDDEAVLVAYMTLRKYHRQLAGRYPDLFTQDV